MSVKHRVGQVRNMLNQQKRKGTFPVKWVFLYGVPRSGTTYVLNQFLKISRCGYGDWELKEFATAINNATDRDWVALGRQQFMDDLRVNLLGNAHLGGGSSFDIAVKQISTHRIEFDFLVELFGQEPEERVFLFRAPEYFVPSAMKKFEIDQEEAERMYCAAIDSYDEIGGKKVVYEKIPEYLGNSGFFSGVTFEPFSASKSTLVEVSRECQERYQAML